MISTRYARLTAAALGIALVPTLVHGYLGLRVDDGRSTVAIPMQLAGLDGRPSDRSLAWAEREFASNDLFERSYGRELTLFVARSYDAKRLYHHPELAIVHGDSYTGRGIVRSPSRPELPLHLLRGERRTALYVLLWGDEFVTDPLRFQLSRAPYLLVRPREMVTLFFARSARSHSADDVLESPATNVLIAAVETFRAQSPTSR